MQRVGRATIKTDLPPVICGVGTIAGKNEAEGPYGGWFDTTNTDALFGQKSWEMAEGFMQREALSSALKSARLSHDRLDLLFAGDLQNQCIASSFGLMGYNLPFIGLFGACSTMIEGLGLATVFVDGGAAARCAAVTSSHFCTSERQFRFPLEYAGQRPPTAQWTVTGSGACIVCAPSAAARTFGKVYSVTFGKIHQLGINDINNMGAAMAPAAADTITAYFDDTGKNPEDFDYILTGDLGSLGAEMTQKLLKLSGLDVEGRYFDCGCMIFNNEKSRFGCGGSGCGCSATMLNSYFLKRMSAGEIGNILFVGTGALMSPLSVMQGEVIPAIAHAVHIGR